MQKNVDIGSKFLYQVVMCSRDYNFKKLVLYLIVYIESKLVMNLITSNNAKLSLTKDHGFNPQSGSTQKE